MHALRFLPLLSLLASPTSAGTLYGCWSDNSVVYHKDCQIAVASLVLSQTGFDQVSWIPNYYVSWGWGNCVARVKATDNGYAVPAINLLASFDTLGEYCQNGWFFYDWGWINAELNGHAGWKRDSIGADPVGDDITLEQRIKASSKTWNDTTAIPHYNTTRPSWLISDAESDAVVLSHAAPRAPIPPPIVPKKQKQPGVRKYTNKLSKRSTWIEYILDGSRDPANAINLWRNAEFTIPAHHPNIGFLTPAAYNNVWNTLYYYASSSSRGIINGGADALIGNSVHYITFSLQIAGNYPSWSNFLGSFHDSDPGTTIYLAILDAIEDWNAGGYASGIYTITNAAGNTIMQIVLNGLTTAAQ